MYSTNRTKTLLITFLAHVQSKPAIRQQPMPYDAHFSTN